MLQGEQPRTSDLDAVRQEFMRKVVPLAAESARARQRMAARVRLLAVEAQLRREPDSLPLRLQRARLLEQANRRMEARNAYADVLELDPAHASALHGLGNLLLAAGKVAAARTILGMLLIQSGNPSAARDQFEQALQGDPKDWNAHAGLSLVLGDLGAPERAAWHRRQVLQGRCVSVSPYRGERPPITILELVSTTCGNIRTDAFLSDRVFRRITVTTEFYDATMPLPPHQLVLNAIGDADNAAAALTGAFAVLAHTTAPVINAPAAVLSTGRCAIARRLAPIPGVVAARTALLARESLRAADGATILTRQGFAFPLLLRSPGFHGGEHFLQVATAEDLRAAAEQLPGDSLLAIQHLDARGRDGNYRKYRVMMIDGQLYPLHVAISSHWKVHYFSADMADHPEHRAEDAAFLADMAGVLGAGAMEALRRIQEALGLDYAGIDFGLSERGEVLLFEANATMAVVVPQKGQCWEYRWPAVERIYRAVWMMMKTRARAEAQ